MPTDRQLAIGGGMVAILGFPAYLGWAGSTFGGFICYTLVAGIGLTAADRLATSEFRSESPQSLFQHAIIRTLSVALVGGVIYGLARIAHLALPGS